MVACPRAVIIIDAHEEALIKPTKVTMTPGDSAATLHLTTDSVATSLDSYAPGVVRSAMKTTILCAEVAEDPGAVESAVVEVVVIPPLAVSEVKDSSVEQSASFNNDVFEDQEEMMPTPESAPVMVRINSAEHSADTNDVKTLTDNDPDRFFSCSSQRDVVTLDNLSIAKRIHSITLSESDSRRGLSSTSIFGVPLVSKTVADLNLPMSLAAGFNTIQSRDLYSTQG